MRDHEDLPLPPPAQRSHVSRGRMEQTITLGSLSCALRRRRREVLRGGRNGGTGGGIAELRTAIAMLRTHSGVECWFGTTRTGGLPQVETWCCTHSCSSGPCASRAATPAAGRAVGVLYCTTRAVRLLRRNCRRRYFQGCVFCFFVATLPAVPRLAPFAPLLCGAVTRGRYLSDGGAYPPGCGSDRTISLPKI